MSFQVDINSRDSVIAVNQTRSQEYGVFRNKKYHYTYKWLAIKYKHLWECFKYLNSQIRQKYIGLETDEVQNGFANRDDHRNSKERME